MARVHRAHVLVSQVFVLRVLVSIAGLIGSLCVVPVPLVQAEPLLLPDDVSEDNVKKLGAVGDGVTDDTGAIVAAIKRGRSAEGDYHGLPMTIFFPRGTYLVKDTIEWVGCCLSIIGEGAGQTIIKLADGTAGFGDANKPKSVLRTTTGNYSFRDNIMNLTVDTGRNNPGAIAVAYYANNSGTLKNVEIRSGDGRGVAGIGMTEQWPGPCLVKNVSVTGFDVGIDVANAEYGPTFENLVLSGQRVAGLRNDGNVIAVRGLDSRNTVPAILNRGGSAYAIVLDSKLTGGAKTQSAIDHRDGALFVRNLTTSGYAQAISNGGVAVPGDNQSEWRSGATFSLFPSPEQTIGLPIAETPEYHDADLSQWVRGFDPNVQSLDAAMDKAFASGKSTVYLQTGVWFLDQVHKVPAHVRRIIGFGAVINGNGGTLRVEENSPNPLIVEQFGYGLTVQHASGRTVVVRHGKIGYKDASGAGDAFLEDLEGYVELHGRHRVWARQINTESLGEGALKMWNDGALLWLMGIKTEGVGPVLRTSGGGVTELFGTLIYPVKGFTAAQRELAAFTNEESSQSLIFAVSAYVENYQYYVSETRDGVTKRLKASDTPGRTMPLFVGYKQRPPEANMGSGAGGAAPSPSGGSGPSSPPTAGSGGSGGGGGSGGTGGGTGGGVSGDRGGNTGAGGARSTGGSSGRAGSSASPDPADRDPNTKTGVAGGCGCRVARRSAANEPALLAIFGVWSLVRLARARAAKSRRAQRGL